MAWEVTLWGIDPDTGGKLILDIMPFEAAVTREMAQTWVCEWYPHQPAEAFTWREVV